jgi:hypothetical protein
MITYQPRHAKRPRRCMHCERDIWPSPGYTGKWADADNITICMAAAYRPGLPTGFIEHTPLPEPPHG